MLRGLTHNQRQHAGQKNHRHQIHACQTRADDEGHDHGTDQSGRRPHTHAQYHLISILHIGHVRGKPCHQSRCAELVDIGKAEGLDILIHGLPQIPREAGRGPSAVLAPHDAEGKAQKRRHHHQRADDINMLHIPSAVIPVHAIVNDGCHKQRDNGFHDDLSDHENRGQKRILFKFFHLSSQCFQHLNYTSSLSFLSLFLFFL